MDKKPENFKKGICEEHKKILKVIEIKLMEHIKTILSKKSVTKQIDYVKQLTEELKNQTDQRCKIYYLDSFLKNIR